jgi:hypothetical protein
MQSPTYPQTAQDAPQSTNTDPPATDAQGDPSEIGSCTAGEADGAFPNPPESDEEQLQAFETANRDRIVEGEGVDVSDLRAAMMTMQRRTIAAAMANPRGTEMRTGEPCACTCHDDPNPSMHFVACCEVTP